MNPKRAQALGAYLKDRRSALGLSTRALASLCNVNMATIVRLEQGAFIDPRPETLRAVAEGLGVSPSELLILAGYVLPEDLPSFDSFLRAKYPELPDSAIAELESVAKRHGLKSNSKETGGSL
ncbi:MAG: helix-turn-helix transcriptional regulator [Gaiellaceae bacterium]